VLIVAAFIAFVRSVMSWSVSTRVSDLLDRILLILLLVELLYTVQVSFRERALVPEPFLLVGLISAIRQILVLSATLGEQQPAQDSTGVVVGELAVLRR
jgi:hypothetical protein